MLTFWLTVIGPILIGTSAIATINLIKRGVLNPKSGINISPLQFLIFNFSIPLAMITVIYLGVWGPNIPEVLPGFWRAVFLCAFVNVFIQFSNAKAASFAKGDASLTAPLQAMTPGMITLLGLILGEWPSKIGVAGILTMAGGSYILLWDKMPTRWWEWFGPVKRLVYLSKLRDLNEEEKSKTLAVSFAFLSACLGTFGLLFDGLFTRRGINMQGATMGYTGLMLILVLTYCIWYKVAPGSKNFSFGNLFSQVFRGLPAKTGFKKYLLAIFFFGFGIAWLAHFFFIWPAFYETFIAYVGTLKRFQILMTVVLAHFLFGEGEFKKRLTASIVVIIGALLISTDSMPNRIATKIEGLGL